MAPLAFLTEGTQMHGVITNALNEGDSVFIFVLVANCFLAALTNFSQFLLTKMTSAVTSQVAGNAKSAIVAMLSILIFKNPVTSTVFVG